MEKVEKAEKVIRSAGNLFNGLVDWWDNNLRSKQRVVAVSAAIGSVSALVILGYGAWHYYYVGNTCQLQELEFPAIKQP